MKRLKTIAHMMTTVIKSLSRSTSADLLSLGKTFENEILILSSARKISLGLGISPQPVHSEDNEVLSNMSKSSESAIG
jgi:hypothetical protein